METVRGTLGQLRLSSRQSQIDPTEARSQQRTRTSYVAQFQVAGRAVVYTSYKPFALTENDDVLVAGTPGRDGSLKAVAIRNAATGAMTSTGFVGWIILAVFLAVFGFMAGVGLAVFVAPWLFIVGLLAGIAGAVYVLRHALQTRAAIRWVETAG